MFRKNMLFIIHISGFLGWSLDMTDDISVLY